MDLLRERETTRVRASLRAVLPAVVTLAAFLVAGVGLGALVETVTGSGSSAGVLLASVAQLALYGVLIGVAVRAAATLERRPVAAFGLTVDADWVRAFAAGVAITVVGIAASLWWADYRGFRAIALSDAGITGPDEPLVAAAVVGLFVLYFLLGNVYEELVYRRIMLGNFAEGLAARGVSPRLAVVVATTASLLLFGAYHVPLRGNVVVAVDAALAGIPFAVAYLLTDDLALPVGVHFGRVLVEFLHGFTLGPFEVTAVVALTANTLPANLEVKLLRVAVVCLGILAWVAVKRDGLRVAARTFISDL